jgi:Arc/MetJ-type ribon-helix-helix transcriptional regulator
MTIGKKPMGNLTNVVKLRGGDTEKMTINVGVVDLGQIDLLVQEGFYSNRSDLIRTAIRMQLQHHADTVKQTVARRTLAVGLQHYSVGDLQRIQAAGQTLRIQALGLVRIAADVSPKLARATIESVSVLGAFQCSEPVREVLADRISNS